MGTITHRAVLVGLVAVASTACGGAGEEAGSDTTAAETSATAAVTSLTETTRPAKWAETTAAATSATVPLPLVPGDFDLDVPAVEGFAYNVTPASPVPWVQLDLPDDVEGFAFGVKTGDTGIGSVVILDDFGLDAYVDRLFDEPVLIEGDAGDEPVEVRAVWRSAGGVPVVAAAVPDGNVGQWVWGHDGLVWVAVGSLAMEGYVAGVVGQQQAQLPAEPHDYGLLAGSLNDRWLTAVPGYLFVDLPVAASLEQIPSTFSGDCARGLYVGHVVPADDPDPLVMAREDLGLVAATIGGVCADGGFLDDLDDGLDRMAMRDDVIGGVPVRRNDTNIVAVDGDDVIHLSSSDPATLVEMEPFITALISKQRQPEVSDINTLVVGSCLFNGAPRSDDPLDRPTFLTDSATPHHGEVFHRFVLDTAGDATYPGDSEVSELANQGCLDAFAGYVGIDYASSRLAFSYYYPSPDGWAAGDRAVHCIIEGSTPAEFLRGSTAQTGQ